MSRIGSFLATSAVFVFLLFSISVSTADENDGNRHRIGLAEQKPLERQTVKRIFAEANSYYEEGLQTAEISSQKLLFEKALLRYKQLVEQGTIVNSRLFCNIGNIYVQLGDRGRAVLWYKRGLYYGPRDYQCKNNLYYLRNRLHTADTGIIRPFFLTPKTAFTLFTIFFSLFSMGMVLLLRVKLVKEGGTVTLFHSRFRRTKTAGDQTWDRIVTALTYTVFSAGFAALIFLAAAFASRVSSPQAVVLEEVTLRSGDGVLFSPIEDRPLTPGTEIVAKEERSGWYRIIMPNRPQGWIPSDSAEIVPFRNPVRERE